MGGRKMALIDSELEGELIGIAATLSVAASRVCGTNSISLLVIIVEKELD
jgi:hypothetical protein